MTEKLYYRNDHEYFGYKLGALEYRSVRFETEVLDTDNYQGNVVKLYRERSALYSYYRT